jgi:hypothetical protein
MRNYENSSSLSFKAALCRLHRSFEMSQLHVKIKSMRRQINALMRSFRSKYKNIFCGIEKLM